MLLLGRKRLLPVVSGFVILSLASSIHGVSDSLEGLNQSYKMVQPLELTPKLSVQLKLHAFLLWSSVGFLMPVGMLLIRFSSNIKSAKAIRVPGALAAGGGGVRGQGGQRLHRPPHVPGEDRQERRALDDAPHRRGLRRGARLPPPGQVEPHRSARGG